MIIAANWKMNKGWGQAKSFLSRFKQLVETKQARQSFVFFPPMGLAGLFQNGDWLWGGQNVHYSPKGAWTGENSALLLKEMGAGFCLVGHSERRLAFGESDQDVEKKFQLLCATDLIPVLCVGEGLEDRNQKQQVLQRQLLFLKQNNPSFKKATTTSIKSEQGQETTDVTNQNPFRTPDPMEEGKAPLPTSQRATQQLRDDPIEKGKTSLLKKELESSKVKSLQQKQIKENDRITNTGFIVAYEPVWAVGSGKTPSVQEIEETALFIKECLGFPALKVLYGGSVNKALAGEFSGKPQTIDGFLIGGASLDPDSLYEISASQK